jgi:hypothetical protein
MNNRPGPDIGRPQQQHQVVAMLWLMSTCQSVEEAGVFLPCLEVAVKELWGWAPARLKRELVEAESVLRTYGGRTTFWFTEKGMEFDYNCTPPEEN